MCWPPTSCTPMTRRFRCWLRVMARPRPDACGPTFAMIVPQAIAGQRRCGLPTRRIARVNIRGSICAASAGLYRLTLMPDLYEGGLIQEAACWAHVRRKFYELHLAHASPIAAEAMKRIAELYAIEGEIRGRPPDERLALRNSRTRPLLESLDQWLQSTLAAVSRKSEIAAAIRYARSRWRALVRYCEDGRIEIDNNAAERALRAVALGRKNYLFAGSDAGGERAAAI